VKARLAHPHPETNPGKLQVLDKLYAEYIRYVGECVSQMIRDQKTSVFPSERKRYFPANPALSSQILNNAKAQSAILVSIWVAGVYGRTLKKHIGKQDLPELEKKQLYTIGKYKIKNAGVFGKATISQEMVDLYWSWVWNPEIAGNPPSVSSQTPMQLNQMTCTFKENTDSKHFSGWWLRFSTLTRRKTVAIPLQSTRFLNQNEGMALSVLVRKTPEGKWVFQFTDKTKEESEVDGSKGFVGVDVGLNVLAATSFGDLYGSGFKRKFDSLRKKVQDLRANRQRQGIKKDSLKLWKLERKLSGQIKTATGTVANKLVKRHPNHTFVIEDLDLSGCKGPKRFAYKALQVALARKAPTLKVNPAFTSQECPSCGHVEKNNRLGTAFRCRSCGRKSHADFVGGLNLLGRSEDKQIQLSTPARLVKAMLEGRYLQKRSRPPRSPLAGHAPPCPRLTVKGSVQPTFVQPQIQFLT
jgi:putative transposase